MKGRAALRGVALAVRFLLELAALGAAAYWGYTRGAGPTARLALAVAAPLVVAIVWGALIAPRAPVPWSQPARNVLGLVVFLGAAAALHSAGRTGLAVAVAAVAILDTVVLVRGRW